MLGHLAAKTMLISMVFIQEFYVDIDMLFMVNIDILLDGYSNGY